MSDYIVSMGIAKVDSRSGEIIKSDIMMSDGWVQYWLQELDHYAINMTHQIHAQRAAAAVTSGLDGEAWERGSGSSRQSQRQILRAAHASVREEQTPKKGARAEGFSMLSIGAKRGMTLEEQEDLLGQGVKDVVMHEVGHILGLRHNFKGSMGVSYECVFDYACSSVHGTTASVMDYVPMNIPQEGQAKIHAFTPVIGGYDKLAIQYGYKVVEELPWPMLAQELVSILEEGSKYDTCYDNDEGYEDPACMAYDFTGDPLRYMDHQLKTYAEAQKVMLQMAVQPGGSTLYYGNAATAVLSGAMSVASILLDWIGGISNMYAHRAMDGSPPLGGSRRPVALSQQKKAIDMLAQLVRPDRMGLTPPGSSLPYFVWGDPQYGYLRSVDLGEKICAIQSYVISNMLTADRVLQVLEQERLLVDYSDYLSLDEYFRLVVDSLIGDGIEDTEHREWNIQSYTINALKGLWSDGSLPASVSASAGYWLNHAKVLVEAAYARSSAATAAPAWRQVASEGQAGACTGFVRFGAADQWSKMHRASGNVSCVAEAFGGVQAASGRACHCLSEEAHGEGLFREHLALLRRDLAGVP
ncbi:unnamed protein product [Prorocentrum cordatum]|uniref:EcxA zinc-binding domain-containing protein n=1 Tax=Prorocentrum cordatum TaxID=2364126 RepID=A0ABN9TRC3_9DINO|nr:unnamed protein product [Polarella glacialis]